MSRALISIGVCLLLAGCLAKTVPGSVTKLNLPFGSSIQAASIGQDGRLWFAFEGPAPEPGLGTIGIYGDPTVFQLPPIAHGYSVNDVAVTTKGSIWIALGCACGQPGYARFSGNQGAFDKIYQIAGLFSNPDGIALAPDGTAWISEREANVVIHVDRNDHLTKVALHDPNFIPLGLIAGADGVYVVGEGTGKVAAIDRRGRVRWIKMPDSDSHLSNLAFGPDGRVWAVEFEANKIVAIDGNDKTTSFTVPTSNAKPDAITVDRNGVVWFTELDTGKIGRVALDGSVRDALLPNGVGIPEFIFVGPRDMLYVLGSTNQWFGLYRTFAVARIPEGTVFP